MDDYYSKQKRGGIVNSKIEHQDAAGIIYSLEILDMNSKLAEFCGGLHDYCILCEGNDDLEFFDGEKHIFIQVKSGAVDKKMFLEILDHFFNNLSKEGAKSCFFVLSCFERIKLANDSFGDKLTEYQTLLRIKDKYGPGLVQGAKEALMQGYGIPIKYSDVLDRLYIDMRPLLKDSADTKAIFSRNLRLVYNIVDIGETKTKSILDSLEQRFAQARRGRGSISEQEIKSTVDRELCKSSVFHQINFAMGYKKNKYGYSKIENLEQKKSTLQCGFNKASASIMRSWRKSHIKALMRTSKCLGSCPQCGHPLIGRMLGLNGIACPDCGFSPYVTLFGFCECGGYYAIKAQPELKEDSIMEYLMEYWQARESTRCEKCSAELMDEYMEARAFFVPVPYPFDDYGNIENTDVD